MRKSYVYCLLGLFALTTFAFYSCKKVNGISNNNVVETPYGLYVADSGGTIYNTNDGDTFRMVYPADGYGPKALMVSGTNLLMVKMNAYYSINNGKNFNPSYDSVSQLAFEQSMILNASDENRLYITSIFSPVGVAYSANNGAKNSWVADSLYDTSIHNVNLTSLTQLKNNVIVGYDYLHHRVLNKNSATDKWMDRTDTAMADTAKVLPLAGIYTLGHYNNTVVAIDYSGLQGAWYSNDTGKTWTKYSGLPMGVKLLSVASPFDASLFIGTDSSGIYRLNANTSTFASVNNGLVSNLAVRAIVGKENIFKNNNINTYIYIATNKGIYRSVDNGTNWIQMINGNFVRMY